MFQLYADKNKLTIRHRELLTSGSVNVNQVRIEFSPDWDSLERVAVFKAGKETRSVLLDDSGECVIPWETLAVPGIELQSGVYGTRGGEVVPPTVWASLGRVLEGAAPGEDARPPAPELWRQELERKQDKLTGLPGQVVGFSESGDAVPVDMPSGGGTTDHRQLRHRDAVEQHPIEAITGLAEALQRIPEPITIKELKEILT